MKPTPTGWPRISNSIYYLEPIAAIDWLARAFGFAIKIKIVGDDGKLHHSELTYGDGMIMVGGESSVGRPEAKWMKSPRSVDGGNTQVMMVFVDDIDAFAAHAKAAGAIVATEPHTNDYGADYWTDRSAELVDLEGHHWWFVQRLRSAGE